jgi:TPR repeat protein
VEAKAALGRHLLTQTPGDPQEGIEWTATAAKEGSGEAAYLLAVLASSGIGVPQDLKASLHHLQQAAERGHRPAQTELAALVGNWRLVREISSGKIPRQDTWERLRAAVDIAAWLNVPRWKRVLGRAAHRGGEGVYFRPYLRLADAAWQAAFGAGGNI